MSRSGYVDYDDGDANLTNLWRGAVASAIRGKRGQAFLKELLAAMDAMPDKRLIAHELVEEGAVCALGSVGRARGITNMEDFDPEDHETIAALFKIPHAMACEIMFMNDEAFCGLAPEVRFTRMRTWVVNQIKPDTGPSAS